MLTIIVNRFFFQLKLIKSHILLSFAYKIIMIDFRHDMKYKIRNYFDSK